MIGNNLESTPKYNIILVEDDEMVRQAISMNLSHYGYGIESFSLAKEALDHIKKHRNSIDLIISDLAMPEIDGTQFMKHLQDEGLSKIPTIIQTGYSDNDILKKLTDLGANECLIKPFSTKILMEKIESHIESGKGITK